MKKSDKILERLSRIAIIMIIWFFVWINYEMKIEIWDGFGEQQPLKSAVRNPITERL